ncbi:hypothetical protein [Mycolicibacterium sp.]|uniref:hypothetical protein n=1 Tax=Mycolicibacterium sp. TaxID=2320850 RepID=UPI00355FCDA6
MPIGGRPVGAASGPSTPPRLVGAGATPPTDLGLSLGGAARALVPVDYYSIEAESDAAAGGTMRITLDPMPQGMAALIERIVIQTDSGNPTSCGIYVGGTEPRHLRDYAPVGDLNIAEYSAAPIWWPSPSPLVVRWESASNGAKGIAHVQARVVQIADVSVAALIGAAR